MTFRLYTIDTAPLKSKENLRKIAARWGFLPNFAAVVAGSPQLLEGFMDLSRQLEEASFSPEEREVIFLTISHKNKSSYCMAAHSKEADETNLRPDILMALHNGTPLSDRKLEALRLYTLGVMENQGRPDDETINTFLAAGYKPEQALEVVLAITLKTLTNYVNRLAHPPIDDFFKSKFLGGYGHGVQSGAGAPAVH
jgi:AhpD family alkylhydroperoxidase